MESLDHLKFRLSLADVEKMPKINQNLIRYQIQTDLRFLVNCILRPSNKKFISLSESVQGQIIDQFPKCDPDKDILEWDNRDEFVLMASRGMLKSVIGAAYLTQVILCAPDVRILIMSGKIEKAQSILDIARKPFLTNEVIHYLFPEWAIDEDSINAEAFTCPNRNPALDAVFRDPTISLASFDSVKAGGHYELILLDDATNEINSSNITNCEKTYQTYDDTDELIEPNGYRIFLGTKWLDDDLPEYIRKKGEEDKEKSGIESVSYFRLPAWKLRIDGSPVEVERRILREKMGALMPDDVILTWPEKLDARFLFKRYRRNRADFYKQYLLDASIEETPKSFTDDILAKQICGLPDFNKIPFHDRSVVIHWDFASVFTGRRKKSEADFTCGIICIFQNSTGRMWVVDVLLQHFANGTDLANAIVRFYKTAAFFGPIVGHSIEDAAGARYLEDQLMQVAKNAKVEMKGITWELPNNDPNAKNVRIALLASAMKSGHVFLMNNINFFDDVKVQFQKWTIDAKRRKDDAPDCIAQAWEYYHNMIFPKTVEGLKPGEAVLEFEPDGPGEVVQDLHADEKEQADIDLLRSMTVGETGASDIEAWYNNTK